MENGLLLDIVSFILLASCWFVIYKDYSKVLALSILGISLGVFVAALVIKFREIKK